VIFTGPTCCASRAVAPRFSVALLRRAVPPCFRTALFSRGLVVLLHRAVVPRFCTAGFGAPVVAPRRCVEILRHTVALPSQFCVALRRALRRTDASYCFAALFGRAVAPRLFHRIVASRCRVTLSVAI
jgi:hypothetical protein